MTILSREEIVKTGPKTAFKFEFLSDRRDPSMTLTFHDNDTSAIFEMANLTENEAIYGMNKIVLPLVKEEVVVEMKDKSGAGAKGKKGGGKKK